MYYAEEIRFQPIISAMQSGGPHGPPHDVRVNVTGNYALYHVTEHDRDYIPVAPVVLTRKLLAEGDRVGFWFADETGGWWSGYTGTDLFTVAAGEQLHLGPATQPTTYYWAMEQYWEGHWKYMRTVTRQNRAMQWIFLIPAPVM